MSKVRKRREEKGKERGEGKEVRKGKERGKGKKKEKNKGILPVPGRWTGFKYMYINWKFDHGQVAYSVISDFPLWKNVELSIFCKTCQYQHIVNPCKEK